MTYAIEIYLPEATSADRVKEITVLVDSVGGQLDFRESAGVSGAASCLTFEFDDLLAAEAAVALIRDCGVHIEGPFPYGDDRFDTQDQITE